MLAILLLFYLAVIPGVTVIQCILSVKSRAFLTVVQVYRPSTITTLAPVHHHMAMLMCYSLGIYFFMVYFPYTSTKQSKKLSSERTLISWVHYDGRHRPIFFSTRHFRKVTAVLSFKKGFDRNMFYSQF